MAGHKYDDKYFDENYYTAFQQTSRTSNKLKGDHYDSSGNSVSVSGGGGGGSSCSGGSGSSACEDGSSCSGLKCGISSSGDIDYGSTDELVSSKKRKVLDKSSII